MLIARTNFQTIQEVRPTISFTLSHLMGTTIEDSSLRSKNLKCFEIQFKATGHLALQIMASIKEMSKKLQILDMHVSYKRGNIILQIFTSAPSEDVIGYVQQKGRFYYINYSIKRKSRNLKLWWSNKHQIDEEYQKAPKIQKFVSKLYQNQYSFKDLMLN